MHQVIKETAHIIESGVHHQVSSSDNFAKINLEVVYPLPNVRELWHYKDANAELIRRPINGFNWQLVFLNTSINEKVDIFKSTIQNVLSNFIPHEFVVSDDKDPPWFNKKMIEKEKNV